MKPEDKALLLIVLAVVVVATAGTAYVFVFAGSLPQSLPVPAGTVFTGNNTQQWAVHFTVGPAGGSFMGGWTAYHGFGAIVLIVVNGTVSKPWPPPLRMCPQLFSWYEYNGSIDQTLSAGAYTVYWSTGYCSNANEIDVTQTIQLNPG